VADDRSDGGCADLRGGAAIATYVLIHGAADSSWYWHLVAPELRDRGHDAVAVDLPCDDDSAGLPEYADAVVEAIGDRTDIVLVAQSLGGFTATLVCERVPVDLLVLVAGMVPATGETIEDWWANTGYEGGHGDPIDVFLHDVPPDLAAEAMRMGRDQSGTPMTQPWPLAAWPDVPTRYLLCTEDRMFSPDFTHRMVRDRLGISPDEIESGHCPALSRPKELAERLVEYQRLL
jgi:pimeloyl-ACP methyl ester carboxylesterase